MKPERIGNRLVEVPEWTTDSQHQAIVRTYHLIDAQEAMVFVNEVAAVAQTHDHYPSIYIFENQVKLRLTTAGADGLTDKDFDLAVLFDQLI